MKKICLILACLMLAVGLISCEAKDSEEEKKETESTVVEETAKKPVTDDVISHSTLPPLEEETTDAPETEPVPEGNDGYFVPQTDEDAAEHLHTETDAGFGGEIRPVK